MGKFNDNFEEMMEEYRKAEERIQPSEEAHEKLFEIPEQAEALKKKNRQKQVYTVSVAAVLALAVIAAGIMVSTGNRESRQEGTGEQQLADISETEGTVVMDEDAAASGGTSEKPESESELSAESESTEDNDGWMTASEIIAEENNIEAEDTEAEDMIIAGLNVRGWVAYEGGLMLNTGKGLPTDTSVHLKKAEGEQVYYAEDYAYDVYLIEEQEDAVAIFINGGFEVYSVFAEGMDITFTVDGVEYAIAYMAEEQDYGDCILTVQDGLTGEDYTVYECANPYTGEVIEGCYYVDITDVMKTLYQELYSDKWQIIEENTEPYMIKDGVEYYGGSEEYYWIAIPVS